MEQRTAAPAPTSGEHGSEALALSRACTALWVATLSLMTAFMQSSAPAHRYLIARKVAKNLGLLREQEQVFTAECRMIFGNLAQRWTAKADQLAPPGPATTQRPRAAATRPRSGALSGVGSRLQGRLAPSDAPGPRAFAHSVTGVAP